MPHQGPILPLPSPSWFKVMSCLCADQAGLASPEGAGRVGHSGLGCLVPPAPSPLFSLFLVLFPLSLPPTHHHLQCSSYSPLVALSP